MGEEEEEENLFFSVLLFFPSSVACKKEERRKEERRERLRRGLLHSPLPVNGGEEEEGVLREDGGKHPLQGDSNVLKFNC